MKKRYSMKMKQLPNGLSRTNVIWRDIERNDVEKGRYSISSNGDVRDNKEGFNIDHYPYKNRIHKFVYLKRLDDTCILANVTQLISKAFLSDDVCSRTVFYFKNRDNDDLYVENIGICKTNVMGLPDKEVHIICKLLEIGTSVDDICDIYNYMRRDIMKRFVTNIRIGNVKRNISEQYQI